MRFDCPQCGAPHEYPDEEIPPGGIVVGCTQCDAHITLNLDAEFDDGKTGIELSPNEEDDPRARSVRIRLDDVDWSEKDDSRIAPPLALSRKEARPVPDGPVDHSGPGTRTMIKRALSSLSQGLSLSDAVQSDSKTPTPSEAQVAPTRDPGDWQHRDLLLALKAPMNVQRLGGSIAGCWLVLVVCANLDALGIWLAAKSEFLGNLTQVIAQACLYAGFVLVGAFIAHHATRELIHGQHTPLRDSIEWVRTWLKSILGVPLICFGAVAAVIIVEGLIGFLGLIPGAGPVLWGLLSPVIFAGSLFAGLVIVLLVYGLPLYLPLIVLERSPPLETIKKMIGLYRSQGLSLVALVSLSSVMSVLVVGLVFAPLLYVSTQLTTQVGKVTMGKDFASVFFSTPEAFAHGWTGLIQPLALEAPRRMETAHDIGGILSGLVGMMGVSAVLATLMVMIFSAGVVILGRIRSEPKAPR